MRRCVILLGTSEFASQVSRPRFRQRTGFFQGLPERPISHAAALAGPEPMLLKERRREPAVLLAEAEREIDHALTSAAAETEAAMAALMPLDGDILATTASASAPSSKSEAPHPQSASVGGRTLTFDGHSFDDDVADLYEDDTALQADAGGVKTAVPRDTVALVTDEFKRLREKEVRRRRKLLHELLNPNPAEYTYDGKLVPVPPLNFGTLSPEATMLGHEMFTGRPYHLVRESPATDHFFEINDLYIEIVFLGRANAGKSSLINALVGGDEVAKTSSLPHCTRSINFYQNASPEELANYARGNPNRLVKLPAGGKQFTLVDVPGFGIEGMSEQWRDDAIRLTDSYLNVRRSVNTAFLCVDADKGLTPSDVMMLEWFSRVHGLVWIVVTKADIVPHSRLCDVMSRIYKLITKSRRKHKNVYPFVLPVSAHTGENIDALRALIVETSGVVPGSQVRDILRKKSHEALAAARELEMQRLRRNELEASGQRQLEAPAASAAESEAAQPVPQDSPLAELVDALAADSVDPAEYVVRSNAYQHVKGNIGAVSGKSKRRDEEPRISAPARHESARGNAPPARREVEQRNAAVPAAQRGVHSKRRGAPQQAAPVSGTTVLVERADGSVVGARGGHALSESAAVELHGERPGLRRLQKRGPSQQWGGGATRGQVAGEVTMSRADRAGYKKHNGGLKHATPEHFWNEVEARKADSAVHTRPKSIRHDKMLEFSHGSRVQWGAMPRGGLRKYGHESKQPSFGSGPSRIKGL
jgi:GTP-binding protein EngB required for normal cell division